MDNYSFSEWVEKKDEAWWPFEKAGRAISGLFGRKAPVGEDPQGIGAQYRAAQRAKADDEDAAAYGRKLYGGMASQARDARAELAEKQRVKFGANDLLKIKASISDYLGLLKNFLSQSQQALGQFGPEARQFAVDTFQQTIAPKYQRLKSWTKWIDDMIGWLPKRESIEEENDLITEAIKVSYRDFEKMAGAIRDLTGATQQWLDALGQRTGPAFQRWARKAFVGTVARRQHHLDRQFQWLANKIKTLMDVRGRQFEKPTRAHARTAPGAYPAGTRGAFG